MSSVRRITGSALAAFAATGTLLAGALGIAPSASAAGATVHGCPSGAVCIYPQNAGWNGNSPSLEFWTGIHNFSGQLGNHYVLNNQYKTDNAGYWVATLCKGSATSSNPQCNGPSLAPYYVNHTDSWQNVDLTPYNSISLYEP